MRRCHRLGVPMRVWGAQCFVMRSTTIAFSSRSSIRKLSTWGVTEGDSVACGRLRGRARIIPGDRSDRIRSRPGQWRTRVFPPRVVVVVDRKRPVPCDKCQFSLVSEARRHRSARIEISLSVFRVCAMGHAIGTSRGDTYGPPPPFCSTIVIVSSPE